MGDPGSGDSVATRGDEPVRSGPAMGRPRDPPDAATARDDVTAPDRGLLGQTTWDGLETMLSIADDRGWVEISYDIRNELQLRVGDAPRR